MVVTKDKEVFLLDYKTGLHDSKYQKQLENYQSAIELMGYKVVKKSVDLYRKSRCSKFVAYN
jgi:hypothetical protein